MRPSSRKVLLAMSGGVDSSVAAALLLEQGYEVVGCFMRLGSPGETLDELTSDADDGRCDVSRCGTGGTPMPPRIRVGHQGCCSINDAADARLVAARLGIPFYVCNFKKDFGRIIDYFVDEYAAGRTPNPCVRCNDWLKFGKLHDYALQIEAAYVASGHYARVVHGEGGARLLRGVDHTKDQSYVLFGAPRDRLESMLFPIGGLEKSRVREIAREHDLPVFNKPDSQEICFVPDNDYSALVEQRRPGAVRGGTITDTAGNILGRHDGQHRFTIGQRRGLSVSLGYPVYVVAKQPETNTVIVGRESELECGRCLAVEANWLCDAPPAGASRRVLARVRYSSEPVGAVVRAAEPLHAPTPSGRTDAFEVCFDEAQRAVTPGQAIVLYDAAEPDWVLGGGWIATTG